jgi:phage recombination protein Bet
MSTALATVPNTATAIERYGMTRDQLDLLKRTIAKGTTDDEFALFMNTANRLGLDAFAKQIFCVKRFSKKENREVMSIQVSIDGYRVTATRTGEDDGQDGPYWCGPDGKWVDVWLDEKNPPSAAKVLVYRKGRARPCTGVAAYASYVQTDRDNRPNPMWERGPDFMIAKCAEALALRKAFPNELGGTIIPEEAGDDDRATGFAPIAAPSIAPYATAAQAAAVVAANAAPTVPAKPAAPVVDKTPLTEDAMADLVEAIGKCTSREAVRAVGLERIKDKPMADEQRDKLRRLCEDQLDDIEKIADADRNLAGAQP